MRFGRPVFSKRVIIHWTVMFTALVGVASGIVQLLPLINLSLVSSAYIIVGSVLGAGVYAWFVTKPSHLPVDDLFPEDLSSEPSMRIECTDKTGSVLEVSCIAKQAYPGVPPLPQERYEQWLMINPNLLICLFDFNHRVVGYCDIFPLRHDFMDMLIAGVCSEHDIRREHILSPREARKLTRLYVGGIAVVEPLTARGRRYASMLIWGVLCYLDHFYPIPPVRELFAQAVTPEGERLLRKFRFQLISPARGRKLSSPLYSGLLTPESITVVWANVPDWSGAVRLGWTSHRRRARATRLNVAPAG